MSQVAAVLLTGAAGMSGCERSSQTAREVAELRTQVAALKLQAQATRDWTLIANLQATYGYFVDKMRWDDAADLFTKNATLEIAGQGLFEGQDRIRTYLHALGKLEHGTLFNHVQLQPVIHIGPDGLAAEARWRTFTQVGPIGKEARWGEATYENAYVKEDGIWKISKLHGYITDYVAKHKNPVSGATAGLPELQKGK
ncbi:MAG: nuclear transport factor 2 family protein [Steroidobacteraceae bacterium]